MNIQKTETEVVVKLEDETIRYGKNRMEQGNLLTSKGVVKLPEWKIDLIRKHGVDIDELQN